jgi:diaminopimelate decarboxylase
MRKRKNKMEDKIFRNRDFLSNRAGKLFVEGVSGETLAEKFSTPLYVYSETRIRANAQRLKKALQKYIPHHQLYYAVKANSNLSVLSIIRSEGLGADASCISEIELALKVKFPRDKILYSGVFHSDTELKAGLEKNVAVNLDSLSAAKRLLKFGIPPLFSMRINPGMGSGKFSGLVFAGPEAKFGVEAADALQAYSEAKKRGVKRFGLHMMTGSCILESKYFPAITEKLMGIAGEIAQKVGIEFEFIDIGGGLGIPYKANEKILDVDVAIKAVAKVFTTEAKKHKLGNPKLMLEPGRYLVGDAGVLLTKTHTLKKMYGKNFVGVDAGMQTLIRPAMYGAYHEIVNASDLNQKAKQKVSVVGPACENTDQFAKGRILPKIAEGDLLAILDTGAYGFVMSSQYNTRVRPAEVLVRGKAAQVIRARETLSEIIGKQTIPESLQK